MRLLLKEIKATINANCPTLVGRTFLGIEDESVKITDVPNGPYCRVTVVGNRPYDWCFADEYGTDNTPIQFSVFATSLQAADALVDAIITAFHGVGVELDSGVFAYGTRLTRGVRSEPKTPDAKRAFHSYVVIGFDYDGG